MSNKNKEENDETKYFQFYLLIGIPDIFHFIKTKGVIDNEPTKYL